MNLKLMPPAAMRQVIKIMDKYKASMQKDGRDAKYDGIPTLAPPGRDVKYEYLPSGLRTYTIGSHYAKAMGELADSEGPLREYFTEWGYCDEGSRIIGADRLLKQLGYADE